jgi:hypothetical protein
MSIRSSPSSGHTCTQNGCFAQSSFFQPLHMFKTILSVSVFPAGSWLTLQQQTGPELGTRSSMEPNWAGLLHEDGDRINLQNVVLSKYRSTDNTQKVNHCSRHSNLFY